MPYEEPTVQVPVSLIETMPHEEECSTNNPILSQPECNCYRAAFVGLPARHPRAYTAADVQDAFERGIRRGEEDANERNQSQRRYDRMNAMQ